MQYKLSKRQKYALTISSFALISSLVVRFIKRRAIIKKENYIIDQIDKFRLDHQYIDIDSVLETNILKGTIVYQKELLYQGTITVYQLLMLKIEHIVKSPKVIDKIHFEKAIEKALKYDSASNNNRQIICEMQYYGIPFIDDGFIDVQDIESKGGIVFVQTNRLNLCQLIKSNYNFSTNCASDLSDHNEPQKLRIGYVMSNKIQPIAKCVGRAIHLSLDAAENRGYEINEIQLDEQMERQMIRLAVTLDTQTKRSLYFSKMQLLPNIFKFIIAKVLRIFNHRIKGELIESSMTRSVHELYCLHQFQEQLQRKFNIQYKDYDIIIAPCQGMLYNCIWNSLNYWRGQVAVTNVKYVDEDRDIEKGFMTDKIRQSLRQGYPVSVNVLGRDKEKVVQFMIELQQYVGMKL